MKNKCRLVMISVATLASVLFLGFGEAGAGASTPAGGSVNVYITPNTNGNGNGGGIVVFTGAIGDYGTTTGHSDKDGKPDKQGAYGNILLKKGTIRVDLAAFGAKAQSAGSQTPLNSAGCSQTISFSAPVTLVSGTGLYQGISGTINLTETVALVYPRYSSGKNKGMCNASNNAEPLATWASITGSGTVSF